MKTSKDLLDESKIHLAQKQTESTWFDLAMAIKISEGSIHSIRRGRSVIPDEKAIFLAEVLPYSEAQILFWLAAERGVKTGKSAAVFEWIEKEISGRLPPQIAANG